jgi:hypothetical protein
VNSPFFSLSLDLVQKEVGSVHLSDGLTQASHETSHPCPFKIDGECKEGLDRVDKEEGKGKKKRDQDVGVIRIGSVPSLQVERS